tara:strand:- start:1702 stop:4311 length:2610 start_codon:yes stop_codon:yes gene_type:complete
MNSNLIRSNFIKFFEEKKHLFIHSSSIVSKNDPSLMFTNAGMNQFKNIFLGNESIKTKRVVNSQKCLRVSGKHNDIEEVGIDNYHHTMFEMLGNWSFGDYFKKEIINWSLEILIEVYKLKIEDLYVTVFEGNKNDKIEKDIEAYNFWSEIIDNEKIIYGNKKDNFWEMGDTGPCGPCSEIHIDLRSSEEKNKIPGKELVNKDHPQVIELWNLVFIQYNRKSNGDLEDLPLKHIDTGMGFERLTRVVQNKKSNYDTDIFTPLINKINFITDLEYGQDYKIDIAFRVISDHVRAVSFCIADGQIPGNTGSSYVIRRLLRRAIRYGYTFLNQSEPFIFKLVETLSDQFRGNFNEIFEQKKLIESIIKEEEKSFLRTLSSGIERLKSMISKSNSKTISGKDVFELFDTYGFPSDLTSLILSEKKMMFSQNDYEIELEKQRIRSKTSSKSIVSDWIVLNNKQADCFCGYDNLESKTVINQYRYVKIKNQEICQIVLDNTPFYPEGGGQSGDKGKIIFENKSEILVHNTKKENGKIIHFCNKSDLEISDNVIAIVDSKNRNECSSNHTSTHLLHQALRHVLGNHVEQKGSSVSSNNLRFDFSHFKKINDNQIKEIEKFVNDRIDDSINLIENRNEDYKTAIDNGAIGLFGEKYGKKVRTIKYKDSYELCGGTHVKNTLNIRNFLILTESSIASGIRRIEAISGKNSLIYLTNRNDEITELKSILSTNKGAIESVKNLKNQNSSLSKVLKKSQKKLISFYSELYSKNFMNEKGYSILIENIDLDNEAMKSLSFDILVKKENSIIVFYTKNKDKLNLICNISKSLNDNLKIDASKIINTICSRIGGAGGGQKLYASGSGPIKNKFDDIAKEVVKSYL